MMLSPFPIDGEIFQLCYKFMQQLKMINVSQSHSKQILTIRFLTTEVE
jgi:hypothetical protein